MIIPSFNLSLVFGIILFTGIFLTLSLLIAAWASILFYLFGKIPQKWIRTILPVAIVLVLVAGASRFDAFMSGTLRGNEFFASSPLVGFFLAIPFSLVTILAMGVITPFPFVREHLALKRPWYAIFAAATVAGTYIFLHNFIVAFGSHPESSRNLSWTPYFQSLTLFSQFLEAIVIAAAVFGVIVFLQQVYHMLAGNQWRRGILLLTVVSLVVLLPAAGIGGLAVFLWQILQKIPGRIIPIGISVAAILILAFTGTILSGIPGMGMIVDYAVITMAIMAFAVLVPFLYLAPAIGKRWQAIILLIGAIVADILLTFLAVTFELGERLTPDPITILTFAEGEIIFAACACIAGRYFVEKWKRSSSSSHERSEEP